jgi:beta-glucosidase-like glycosyl hydrolase
MSCFFRALLLAWVALGAAGAPVAPGGRTCSASALNHRCYLDFVDGKTRLLSEGPFSVTSKDECAVVCDRLDLTLSGVEDDNQCFCGNEFNPPQKEAPLSECKEMGAADRLLVFPYECVGKKIPAYQGCITDKAKSFKYCDMTLSAEERVDALISALTSAEKIQLLAPNPSLGSTCNDHTGGVERLDIPNYMWLVETNTAVAAACLGPDKCAVVFNGPLGLAASFNRTVWEEKGRVISTEMRAFNNLHWPRGTGPEDFIGLTGFGPNINIARDPRFGRTSELPGEDPYLNGHYAKHMVQGMMEEDDHGHPRMLPYLKHFTAYSTEKNRGHDTYNISMHDFFDTYLAQYEIAFQEGKPVGAMCSYNAENGFPSCANNYLLNIVVREMWNRTDAHITTDCGAVTNLRGPPINAASDMDTVLFTIRNGTDLEMGSSNWIQELPDAVQSGQVSEKVLDEALRRGFIHHFRAGRFDDLGSVAWSKVPGSVINSTQHRDIQFSAGLQSVVLLKNDDKSALPLVRGTKIAVVGPMGVTRAGLLSDYAGDQQCFSANDACIPTIAEAIALLNTDGVTQSAAGVDVNSNRTDGIQAAIQLVESADAIVLALGIDKTIEHEGIDRVTIDLPGLQNTFAEKIYEVAKVSGKPLVLILCNGGPLAIDGYVEQPNAIVEAFNLGGAGSSPLASLLFGDANKWGKLPYTIYPKEYVNQQSMVNYDMAKYPGRTYKYYQEKAVFAFGYGLSYTAFKLTCTSKEKEGSGSISVVCNVENVGNMGGDEVLMVFHSAGQDIRDKVKHPVPIKQLIDFQRVAVSRGATESVAFSIDKASEFALINEDGVKTLYKGRHNVIISRGHGNDVNFPFQV